MRMRLAELKSGSVFREHGQTDRHLVTNRCPTDAITTCVRMRDGLVHDMRNSATVVDLTDKGTEDISRDIEHAANRIRGIAYETVSELDFMADSEATEIADRVRAVAREMMRKPFGL